MPRMPTQQLLLVLIVALLLTEETDAFLKRGDAEYLCSMFVLASSVGKYAPCIDACHAPFMEPTTVETACSSAITIGGITNNRIIAFNFTFDQAVALHGLNASHVFDFTWYFGDLMLTTVTIANANFAQRSVATFFHSSTPPLLTSLKLPNCSIGGVFGGLLGFASTLIELDLSNNALSGTLVDIDADQLTTLDLRNNGITDGLANINTDTYPMLEVLDVSSNAFGVIMDDMNHAVLWSLDVSNNAFYGPMPTFFAMDALAIFNASFNSISTPSELAPMTLRELYLQSNLLSGPLAPMLTSPLLQEVNIQDNSLVDTITCLEQLFQLRSFKAANNLLEGAVPRLNLTALEWLDLRNNALRQMSNQSSILPALRWLDLSGNPIGGSANLLLDESPLIDVLYLNSTQLYGDFDSNLQMTNVDLCNITSTCINFVGESFCVTDHGDYSMCALTGICYDASRWRCDASCSVAVNVSMCWQEYSDGACKWCDPTSLCMPTDTTYYCPVTCATVENEPDCARAYGANGTCRWCAATEVCGEPSDYPCHDTCHLSLLAEECYNEYGGGVCTWCNSTGGCIFINEYPCHPQCEDAWNSLVCTTDSGGGRCDWCEITGTCYALAGGTYACDNSCNIATNASRCASEYGGGACAWCEVVDACLDSSIMCNSSCSAADSVDKCASAYGGSICSWCPVTSTCDNALMFACLDTCRNATSMTECDNMYREGGCTWCSPVNTCYSTSENVQCPGSCATETNSSKCGQLYDGTGVCAWCATSGLCLNTTHNRCDTSCSEASDGDVCINEYGVSNMCRWCEAATTSTCLRGTHFYCENTCYEVSNSTACAAQYGGSACRWCASMRLCVPASRTCVQPTFTCTLDTFVTGVSYYNTVDDMATPDYWVDDRVFALTTWMSNDGIRILRAAIVRVVLSGSSVINTLRAEAYPSNADYYSTVVHDNVTIQDVEYPSSTLSFRLRRDNIQSYGNAWEGRNLTVTVTYSVVYSTHTATGTTAKLLHVFENNGVDGYIVTDGTAELSTLQCVIGVIFLIAVTAF